MITMYGQRGFTLIESLAVIAILITMLGVTMALMRPTSYAPTSKEAARRTSLALLAQGLVAYKQTNGHFPAGIPSNEMQVANIKGGFDLCKDLVPVYLNDIPFDPDRSIAFTGEASNPTLVTKSCQEAGVNYASGFILRQSTDAVIVSAVSQTGQKIEVQLAK